MNGPMFELRGLSIAYGKLEALKSVSLAFGQSELVAVVGPNGAGKTTLIAIMAGLRTQYIRARAFSKDESCRRGRESSSHSGCPSSRRACASTFRFRRTGRAYGQDAVRRQPL